MGAMSDNKKPMPIGFLLTKKQWFHPSAVSAHPNLEGRLRDEDHINFDWGLAHFGIVPVDLETIGKKSLGLIPGSTLGSSLKRAYNNFVMIFLALNLVRLFVASFISDRSVGLYLGDFSHYWTKKRHILDIPLMFWGLYALIINILFNLVAKERDRQWLIPFSMFKGVISPAEARIRSLYQMETLIHDTRIIFKYTHITVYVWTGLAAMLNFGTAIRYFPLQQRAIPLFWATIQTIWAYYVIGITCWILSYFHTLCFYLRIRFKRLNRIVFALLQDNKGEIPFHKRNAFLREVIYEHNNISHSIGFWNRFWKFYCLVSYFTYVPMDFWFLYGAIFTNTGYMVKITLWILFFQMSTFLGITIGSGEMVSNQAHMSYRWLNALCLHKFPVYLKFKMAGLLERMGGPSIGFTCFDFFVVARETFYDMSILLGTYYLLIVDFVISYL